MKLLLILSLATLACSAKLYISRPVNILEILREKTLADDFRDLKALIPERKLEDLVRRYLLGDAEFQAIIRYFGSPEVFKALGIIRSQPEIKGFNKWLQQQLQTGPLDLISDESSSEELYHILNRAAVDQDKLDGWKGFIIELLAIYPQQEIRNLIRDKVAANGVFTEFWNKVIALRPVYERILKLPEIRKVTDKLRELGMDIRQMDQLIRDELGWKTGGGSQQLEGNKLGKLPNKNGSGLGSAPILPEP